MDTNLILVSAFIIALIFVPIFLLIRVGNTNKRKLRQRCNTIAVKNGLKISEKEFWGNAIIAIDLKNQKLLFLRYENESFEENIIDLTNYKECNINAVYSRAKTKYKKANILEKVDLQVDYNGNNTAIKTLNFYDNNRLYGENLELLRAEKWKKIIKNS
ncbi:hypothetical protein [Aurantibacter sp.]|uniref:hypothetical protein n=1 Tax=Aurantibacter sp. TaxID=2807103 RepID=UPI003267A5A9